MARRSYSESFIDIRLPNAVQDYDGNWYDAVLLGSQVWLGSNLRTTHYANGTALTDGSTLDDGNPSLSMIRAYYYNNTGSDFSLAERGLLYNDTAIMNSNATSTSNPSGVQGIAMTNWHIPSEAEFNQLFDYLKSRKKYVAFQNFNGKHIAKTLASSHGWITSANTEEGNVAYNQSTNNKSNFTALPVGNILTQTGTGSFGGEGTGTTFAISRRVTSKTDYFRAAVIYADMSDAYVGDITFGGYSAVSVRCVCDLTAKQFLKWYVNQYGTLNHQLN